MMRDTEEHSKDSAQETVRDIRRAMRWQFSTEEKIRIVLEGLGGEESIAELCRKEKINQNSYYRWSSEFLEAGKKVLSMRRKIKQRMLGNRRRLRYQQKVA